jgi:hypothetical protein
MTDKPTIFAANVKEADLATADSNPHVPKSANTRAPIIAARRSSSARKSK